MHVGPGIQALCAAVLALGLSACATDVSPPRNIDNACSIMQDREDWYTAARAASKKWKAPTPTILAIIWRESQFKGDAQTPRRYALGVVPWGRQSSAYGFAQAIDGTWDWYEDETGNDDADREDFADAADFVGWYMDKSRKRLGLRTYDARTHYLAYHEGHGGFKTGRWKQKKFLVRAAGQVAQMASLYDSQLRGCDAEYARERMLAKTPLPRTRPFALVSVPGVIPVVKPKKSGARIVPASVRVMPIAKPNARKAEPDAFVLPEGV